MGFAMRGSKKFTASAMTAAFVTSLLVACTPSPQRTLSPSEQGMSETNIIGGDSVNEGSPLSSSVVLLVNALTKEVCTGSLVGETFAITAAHCVDTENPENMYVYFAAKPHRKTERRQVIAAMVSPYWKLRQKKDKNTADIAVIKFAGNKLPQGYVAAKFLQDDSILQKGTATIVLGYGVDDATTMSGLGVLRFTTLQISDPNYSQTELVLDQSQGSGVCHGDSGGPAYVYIKNQQGTGGGYYLWGIANHATNDDADNLCNKGVIYTNATLYLTWINDVTKTL